MQITPTLQRLLQKQRLGARARIFPMSEKKGTTSIVIQNNSFDTVEVTVDEEVFSCADKASFTVHSQKSTVKLLVRRKRSTDQREDVSQKSAFERVKSSFNEQGHLCLSSEATLTFKSKKVTVIIAPDLKIDSKYEKELLFSGYTLNVSGANCTGLRSFFADKKMKRKLVTDQLVSSFFPVGALGFVLIALSLFAFNKYNSGAPLSIDTLEFTLGYCIGMLGVGLAAFCVFAVNAVRVLRTAKKYTY